MTVAQKMKLLIEQKGITYTFISEKTGIPVDALSKSFLGKRRLPADEMISICREVGIDLSDLAADRVGTAPPLDGAGQGRGGAGMDMEKVKAFAVRILEECEQEGLTVAEAQMIPQELRFALERRILEIHEHTAVTRPQTAQ